MTETTPFTPFSASHWGTLAVVLLVSLGVPWWLRGSRSQRLVRSVAVGTGLLAVLHELVKTWALVAIWHLPIGASLPLEICGVSAFLAAALLIWRSYRIYEVVYFWGLAGAVQAVLTPAVAYEFPHPFFLSFFLSHGLILFGLFYATLVFRLRPTWRSIPRVIAITLFYAFIVVAPLNLLLDTNYMFLRGKPPTASVLDWFGPWPWYIVTAAGFTLASFVFYYLPFWIRDLSRCRSETRQRPAASHPLSARDRII